MTDHMPSWNDVVDYYISPWKDWTFIQTNNRQCESWVRSHVWRKLCENMGHTLRFLENFTQKTNKHDLILNLLFDDSSIYEDNSGLSELWLTSQHYEELLDLPRNAQLNICSYLQKLDFERICRVKESPLKQWVNFASSCSDSNMLQTMAEFIGYPSLTQKIVFNPQLFTVQSLIYEYSVVSDDWDFPQEAHYEYNCGMFNPLGKDVLALMFKFFDSQSLLCGVVVCLTWYEIIALTNWTPINGEFDRLAIDHSRLLKIDYRSSYWMFRNTRYLSFDATPMRLINFSPIEFNQPNVVCMKTTHMILSNKGLLCENFKALYLRRPCENNNEENWQGFAFTTNGRKLGHLWMCGTDRPHLWSPIKSKTVVISEAKIDDWHFQRVLSDPVIETLIIDDCTFDGGRHLPFLRRLDTMDVQKKLIISLNGGILRENGEELGFEWLFKACTTICVILQWGNRILDRVAEWLNRNDYPRLKCLHVKFNVPEHMSGEEISIMTGTLLTWTLEHSKMIQSTCESCTVSVVSQYNQWMVDYGVGISQDLLVKDRREFVDNLVLSRETGIVLPVSREYSNIWDNSVVFGLQ